MIRRRARKFRLQHCKITMAARPHDTSSPLHAIHSARHRPVLGIALKLASVVLFAGMTLCVKLLGNDIPSGQTIFVRGLLSATILALIAWRTAGLHLLKTQTWRSHALRSLSGTLSMFCFFTAVTMIPLADLTAIN